MQINGHRLDLAIWIRFAIQCLMLLGGLLAVYFKIDNRVTNLERLEIVQAGDIHDMDSNGTRKSHEIDPTQQMEIDETIRRVTNIEGVLHDLTPKVERIDANVMVLMAEGKKR